MVDDAQSTMPASMRRATKNQYAVYPPPATSNAARITRPKRVDRGMRVFDRLSLLGEAGIIMGFASTAMGSFLAPSV